jgi:hypothetical protein
MGVTAAPEDAVCEKKSKGSSWSSPSMVPGGRLFLARKGTGAAECGHSSGVWAWRRSGMGAAAAPCPAATREGGERVGCGGRG